MKRMLPASLFLCSLLLMPCIAQTAFADGSSPVPTGLQPVFSYSARANDPIIEYNQVHALIAQADPVPLLRVYGDGRVRVHIPAYMKRAGDYELTLKPAELNDLLRSLADDGILDFDAAAARQQKEQIEIARRAASGEAFYLSDATQTVINVRLNRYQRTPASQAIDNFSKQFKWKNLKQDALRYPSSDAIRRASSAATALEALCEHPALQKLP